MMLGNTALMEDFNINLDPDSTDLSSIILKLKDRLLEVYPLSGLVQVVEKCKGHCQEQKSSLIDQMWFSNVLKPIDAKKWFYNLI